MNGLEVPTEPSTPGLLSEIPVNLASLELNSPPDIHPSASFALGTASSVPVCMKLEFFLTLHSQSDHRCQELREKLSFNSHTIVGIFLLLPQKRQIIRCCF